MREFDLGPLHHCMATGYQRFPIVFSHFHSFVENIWQFGIFFCKVINGHTWHPNNGNSGSQPKLHVTTLIELNRMCVCAFIVCVHGTIRMRLPMLWAFFVFVDDCLLSRCLIFLSRSRRFCRLRTQRIVLRAVSEPSMIRHILRSSKWM